MANGHWRIVTHQLVHPDGQYREIESGDFGGCFADWQPALQQCLNLQVALRQPNKNTDLVFTPGACFKEDCDVRG